MLVYTLIQSPGYYLGRNGLAFVAMFAVCFFLTLLQSPAFKPLQQTPAARPE